MLNSAILSARGRLAVRTRDGAPPDEIDALTRNLEFAKAEDVLARLMATYRLTNEQRGRLAAVIAS